METMVKEYDENGYALLEGVFSGAEVDALVAASADVSGADSPQRIFERDGALVRAVYGVHLLNRTLDALTRDARMVEPARAMLRSDVYIHQTQLNPKAPFEGDVWEWHQDFLYWNRDDGMPGPRVLSAALYLDDVTEFNGPLFLIPGSQHSDLESETSTYAEGWEKAAQGFRHRIRPETLARLMDRHGLVSTRARRGSVLVFDGRLLHCSPPNLSASVRTVLFIRYNAVDNALQPVPAPRPEWVASRNPTPVAPLDRPFLDALRG